MVEGGKKTQSNKKENDKTSSSSLSSCSTGPISTDRVRWEVADGWL